MKKYLLGLVAISLVVISGVTVFVNHRTEKSNVYVAQAKTPPKPSPTPTPTGCQSTGPCTSGGSLPPNAVSTGF
jgi:uncharacterized protein YxeA